MLSVQFLPLVVQIFLSQVLDVQQTLDNLIHSAIYESLGQITQHCVGQALLKPAFQRMLSQCQTNLELLNVQHGNQTIKETIRCSFMGENCQVSL